MFFISISLVLEYHSKSLVLEYHSKTCLSNSLKKIAPNGPIFSFSI